MSATEKAGLMYRSKQQVKKKLAQATYVLKEMQKYRGKVFVNNGVDPETGAYPLQVNISSFLALTRSVLQSAFKESEAGGTIQAYDSAVNKRPIIALFRDLRNTDMKEIAIGTHTVISFNSQLYKTEAEAKKYSESNSKEAKIVNQLSKPITVTDSLIEQFRNDGRADLIEAVNAGKPLYKTVNFEGEEDLYALCENYIASLNDFVIELVQKGVIS